MNNSIIIGIVIAIVALIAGGYWFYSNISGNAGETAEHSEVQASVGRTFAQLFGSAQALECTYEFNDGTNVSSGTVYMTDAGARIRGDFNFSQTGAGPMEMHMVRADGYNYMWGSSMPQGIKTKVTTENQAELFGGSDDANAAALNNTQYHCSAWSGDSSKFVVPANIEFMDMSSMMDAMKGASGSAEIKGSAGTDMKAMQCAACDQAGPARDQCREALGCR